MRRETDLSVHTRKSGGRKYLPIAVMWQGPVAPDRNGTTWSGRRLRRHKDLPRSGDPDWPSSAMGMGLHCVKDTLAITSLAFCAHLLLG